MYIIDYTLHLLEMPWELAVHKHSLALYTTLAHCLGTTWIWGVHKGFLHLGTSHFTSLGTTCLWRVHKPGTPLGTEGCEAVLPSPFSLSHPSQISRFPVTIHTLQKERKAQQNRHQRFSTLLRACVKAC